MSTPPVARHPCRSTRLTGVTQLVPRPSLPCGAGVWTYYDSIAQQYRPYPTELLTSREQSLTTDCAPTVHATAPASLSTSSEYAPTASSDNAVTNEVRSVATSAAGAASSTPAVVADAPQTIATTLPALDKRIPVSFSGLGQKARKAVPAAKPVPAHVDEATQPTTAASTAPPEPEAAAAIIIDSANLICLLCQRRFGTMEHLQRHTNFSLLHKQNLEGLASQG